MKHLSGGYRSGASILGRIVVLPTNIRLDWKGLPGTNTLAHYENSKILTVKSFIRLDLGQKEFL